MIFDNKEFRFLCAAIGIGGGITLICLVLNTSYATTYIHFGLGAAVLLVWGVYSFCKAVENILAERNAASVAVEE